MKEISVLILAALVSSAAASCLLDKRIRGQWWVVNDNGDRIQDEAITVSNHIVEIERGNKVTKYSCSHTSGYLVQLQPVQGEGYICLEFVPADSSPNIDFSVIRRVHHTSGRMPVIQPTGLDQCSRSGDLGTVKIRRTDPGCTFPSELQGKWTFAGNFIKDISIEKNTLSIQAFDFNTMEFGCERFQMEGNQTYMFALRKEHVTKNKDGCLCFRFHFVPMPEGDKDTRVLAGQRFSSGTPIKLIDQGAPIHLHQTCDYVDTYGTDTWHMALPH